MIYLSLFLLSHRERGRVRANTLCSHLLVLALTLILSRRERR
jgi:hypothetical protein